jgi:hypothetical protein
MHSWQTARRSLVGLVLLFVVDVACTTVLLLSAHGYDWSRVLTSGGQLTAFASDVLDLALMVIVRVVALIALGFITVRYGTPPFELQADARRRVMLERDTKRTEWRRKMGLPPMDDEELGKEASTNGLKSNGTRKLGADGSVTSDDKRQPLLSIQDRSEDVISSSSAALARSVSWSDPSVSDAEARFEATLPAMIPAVTLSDPEKLVQSRRARWIKNCLESSIFMLATCMQVYCGTKMVGYHFDNEWHQGLLMAAIIVSINAEQSLLRYIIDWLTKEEGYLFVKLSGILSRD